MNKHKSDGILVFVVICLIFVFVCLLGKYNAYKRKQSVSTRTSFRYTRLPITESTDTDLQLSTMFRLPPSPKHTYSTEVVYEALVTEIDYCLQRDESLVTLKTPSKVYTVTVPLDCQDESTGVYYIDDPSESINSKELRYLDLVNATLLRGDTEDDYSLIDFDPCQMVVPRNMKKLRKINILHPFARLNPFIFRHYTFNCLFEALVFSMVAPQSITNYYRTCKRIEKEEDTNYASHIIYRQPETYRITLCHPCESKKNQWIQTWTLLMKIIYKANKDHLKLALSVFSDNDFIYYEDPWVPSLVGGRFVEKEGKACCFLGYNIIGSLWMNLRNEIFNR